MRYFSFILTITLLNLFFSFMHTAHAEEKRTTIDTPLTEPLHQATIVDLLANYEHYHGKKIIVNGFLGPSFSDPLPSLYLVSEHIKIEDPKLGIRLIDQNKKLFEGKYCDFLGSYIQVIGRFNTDNFLTIEKINLRITPQTYYATSRCTYPRN